MTWLGVTLGVTTLGVPVSLPGVVGVPLGVLPGEEAPELDGGVWLHASECRSRRGERRKPTRATARTGRSRTNSLLFLTAPVLEDPLGHKDDVVGLQGDVVVLVRSPHHLINIYPNSLPLFPLTPEDVDAAARGHRGQATPLGDCPNQRQVLFVLDGAHRANFPLEIDEVGKRSDHRVARLELDVLREIAFLHELREVDGDQLVLAKDEALFGIRGGGNSADDADGLEEAQVTHELDRSRFAETAHEVDGTALDVADDDGDRRSLHCLRIDG